MAAGGLQGCAVRCCVAAVVLHRWRAVACRGMLEMRQRAPLDVGLPALHRCQGAQLTHAHDQQPRAAPAMRSLLLLLDEECVHVFLPQQHDRAATLREKRGLHCPHEIRGVLQPLAQPIHMWQHCSQTPGAAAAHRAAAIET